MTSSSGTRLDTALVERALAPSRGRAQSLIAAGLVTVDGRPARSAAEHVAAMAELRLSGRDHPWASRGGLKLDAALSALRTACAGRVCLDAGASTGGFTDVLLTRGARLVYAVDVGRGLLDGRLAADPRVQVMDGTNIRSLDSLPGPRPELVCLDLAFISLRAVLANVTRLAPGAEALLLFKPQFELGRAAVARGGVVRSEQQVAEGLAAFEQWASHACGASRLSDSVPAAVRGAKGNQEWFVHLRLNGAAQ